MSPKQNRSIAEVLQVSDHLYYEIWMLYQTAAYLFINTAQIAVTPVCNALIESFVIHARNLLDVFYGVAPFDGDVVAEDFFDNKEKWKKIRPKQSVLLIP